MSVVVMPSRSQVSDALSATPRQAPERVSGGAVTRRGTVEQGRALEVLGHAVEYLVDSRLFTLDEGTLKSDGEAVQIMMRLSRAVFAECPQVISGRRPLKLWLVGQMSNPPEVNHSL